MNKYTVLVIVVAMFVAFTASIQSVAAETQVIIYSQSCVLLLSGKTACYLGTVIVTSGIVNEVDYTVG